MVDRTLEVVLALLMAGSVLNVLWQVFSRFVLQDPSSFTEELARYLLVWIGVLGSGWGVGRGSHLALDLLPQKLHGRRRRAVRTAISVSIALFALSVMLAGGIRLVSVMFAYGQTSAALGIPLGYVYLVVPLSGACMLFYAAADLAGAGRAGSERSTPDMPPEAGPPSI